MNLNRGMKHPELQAFLDGELSESRRRAVTRHLQGCRRCCESLQRLADAERRLTEAQPESTALSAEASQAIFERAFANAALPSRASLSSFPGFQWRLAGACAAALVLGTLGFLKWSNGIPQTDDGNSRVGPIAAAPTTPNKPGQTESFALNLYKGKLPLWNVGPAAIPQGAVTGSAPESAPAPRRHRHRFHSRPLFLASGRSVHPRRRYWHKTWEKSEPMLALDGNSEHSPAPLQTLSYVDTGKPDSSEQLLVVLESPSVPPPPTLTVQVTHESPTAPGSAQVAAYRPDSTGRGVWTQYAVAQAGTGETAARYTRASVEPDLERTFLAVCADRAVH